MADDASSGIAVRSSIERGDIPRPGSRPPPYFWPDVLEGPPPIGQSSDVGSYVVYHGVDLDIDVRYALTTQVSVVEVDDDGRRIEVDSRVSLEARLVPGTIARIRQGAEEGARIRRGEIREAATDRLETVSEWSTPPLRSFGEAVIRGWARLLLALVAGFRTLLLGLVEVPDRVVAGALRAQIHLSTSLGRRSLFDAVKDPRSLTLEQRSVMVFLVGVAALLTVVVLNSVFALILPQWASIYRRVLLDVVLMALGVLVLPVVEELMVVVSTLELGPVLALLGLMTGKLVGVWIVYLLGTSLHDVVERRTRDHPRWRRGVEWMQENADRYGFPLLVGANAVPFLSALVLYPLAITGMRFRSWMSGIAAGTMIRYVAIVVAIFVVGPARVEELFRVALPVF